MQQKISAVTPLTTVVSRCERSAALMGGYSAFRTREVWGEQGKTAASPYAE